MKETVKSAVTQFFVIVVGMLLITGLGNYLAALTGAEIYPNGYPITYPLEVLLTGVCGALPSFLLYSKKEPTRGQAIFRQILHFLAVEAVVLLLGYVLNWYTSVSQAAEIAVMILLVYAFVNVCLYFAGRSAQKAINEALRTVNECDEDG